MTILHIKLWIVKCSFKFVANYIEEIGNFSIYQMGRLKNVVELKCKIKISKGIAIMSCNPNQENLIFALVKYT